MADIVLPNIIGLPPLNIEPRTNSQLLNSMPIAEIEPSWPSFQGGIDLFTLVPAMKRYRKLLLSYGYDIDGHESGNSIKVAFLADSFPTDTFQNEYGENFLQKFTDVASEGAASINQFMGTTKATDAVRKVIENLTAAGGVAGAIGGALGAGGDVLQKIFNAIAPSGSGAARSANLVNRLAAGARIDFPQVWKTSTFTPSYTMTIRLYNPNPRSDNATKQYIIGPIAALMLLGIPLTEDGSSYNWPFLHKIRAAGIYNLDPAFIQTITIVKGGDQQQISYNQRLSMVDVRIDFGSLYNTMVAGRNIRSGRPTLRKYIEAMEGKRSVYDRLGEVNLDSRSISLTPQLAPTATQEEGEVGRVTTRTPEETKSIQDRLNALR